MVQQELLSILYPVRENLESGLTGESRHPTNDRCNDV